MLKINSVGFDNSFGSFVVVSGDRVAYRAVEAGETTDKTAIVREIVNVAGMGVCLSVTSAMLSEDYLYVPLHWVSYVMG